MIDHPCSDYGSLNPRHEWGDWTAQEERGVLVVTHGPRVGRIYAVEQTTHERACTKCGEKERRAEQPRPLEWPVGMR